jgi:hypothetical protein
MLSKAIGKEACLWARNHFGLPKDPGPKRHPNILRKDDSKEIKDFTKMKDGGVHCNRYDDRCMKQ